MQQRGVVVDHQHYGSIRGTCGLCSTLGFDVVRHCPFSDCLARLATLAVVERLRDSDMNTDPGLVNAGLPSRSVERRASGRR
jgi:hypothetical protein